MSDRATVCMALAAAVGAWLSVPIPLVVAVGVVGVALIWRRPWAVVLGVALLTAALGARAWAGLDPVPAAPVAATVTLVSDPVDVDGSVRVDVRLGRRRLEAWARGSAAVVLRPRLAGERVELVGRTVPVPPQARARLARRHVAGRLTVEAAGRWAPGDPLSTAANGVRRTLARGARPMGLQARSLFAGLVLGDRRGQSPEMEHDFRASGLSHLLAVSGQNVAFVLTLARPLVSRLRVRARFAGTLGVIAFFALLTRGEPSVLRASAMASVAATAFATGRPSPPTRLLALAVTAVLVIDPLLVGSLAFLLSVGASAGILAFGPAIASRLPGPAWAREPVAVTIAAQVGVAPVLVPAFGGLPLVSVPANLLVAPVTGPVMVWGLPAGLAAGVLGEPAAGLLHVPTGLLVRWIAGVARWAAAAPLGDLRPSHALAVTALAAGALATRSLPVVARRTALGAATAWVLLVAAFAAPTAPAGGIDLTDGAVLWRAGGATVVSIGAPDTGALLDGLRVHGVHRVDVVVVARGTSARTAEAVRALRRRAGARVVLAPEGHRIRDARVPVAGTTVGVGDLDIVVRAVRPVLDVDVRETTGGGRVGADVPATGGGDDRDDGR